MKRLFLISSIILSFFSMEAQTDSIASILTDQVSVRTYYLMDDLLTLEKMEHREYRNSIYQTVNINILSKLDTQTGRLELIQWALKSKDEFSVSLNSEDLSYYHGMNSFELYPTKNMFQFILLDKATGRNWHVQWGTKDSERWIRRIY